MTELGTITRDLECRLPGYADLVSFPCDCPVAGTNFKCPVPRVIVHLNDRCGWTREAIADWLDTLDVDLAFTDEPLERAVPDRIAYVEPPSVWLTVSSSDIFDEIAAFTTKLNEVSDGLKNLGSKFAWYGTVSPDEHHTAPAPHPMLRPKSGSQNYLKLKEKDRERTRRRTR